jgi:hypothetical protein
MMDLESMKKVWEAYLEVTEKKLSPKQKELDHDGDGDIEGDDLAALRAKKAKKKEESSCGKDRMKKENDNGDDDKEECPKCKGKGCDHCDNKGYHMKEEAPADPIKGAPARRGDKKNGDKSMATDYPELTREFAEVLERAVATPEKKHTKGATKPEGLLDKESPKSKEFVDMHKVDNTYTDFEEKGHDDVEKAGRAVKSQASSRRGDNLGNGDSKSPEKVKDNS